jgi:hypothetical protein
MQWVESDLVSVSSRQLRRLQLKANKLVRSGAGPGDPVWDLSYELGRLVFDTRLVEFEKTRAWCARFFGAQTHEEEAIARAILWRFACPDGNYWIGDLSERLFRQRLARLREAIKSQRWIDENLGPKRTLVFIGMCRRQFGRAVGNRMMAIHQERVKARESRQLKKKEKQKRADETVESLRKYPFFNSEGALLN